MKITFICVGSVRKTYIKDGVEEYLNRIKRYSPVEVIETKEGPGSLKMPRDEVLKDEGERIIKKLKAGNRSDYLIALDERGRSLTSKGFAEFIDRMMSVGKNRISFIVGGAYGLHNSVTGLCDMSLSLSAMTLPHDLARLVLAEQVYRAFTIIKGEPYSH